MTDQRGAAVRRIDPAYSDARGTITDILENVPITHVTIITTRAGAVRGNHYHKCTQQRLYLVEGRMRLTTRIVGQASRSVILEKGDLVVEELNEHHAMRAIEDTTFLVFTSGPRGGADFESDTFRLGADELLERPD